MKYAHVARDVTTVKELLLADVTLERFGTGVRPVVPSQVGRPGKLLSASDPWALVRLLPRVDHHVLLQA